MSLGALVKKHLVDCTAQCVVAHPLFATFETLVAQLSIEQSIHARLNATVLTLAGLGLLYTKGLDTSRCYFKIDKDSSFVARNVHDAFYGGVYNVVVGPPMYFVAGVHDIPHLAAATGVAIGVGLFIGAPIGYTVDTFRQLTGVVSPDADAGRARMKQGIAAIITAGSLALVGGVYAVSSALQ